MIKFFRKIRQQLFTENKFRKYLLYAIGEIVLVVFGILIALSINNSNNVKEQRKIEQEYLVSLQGEFQTNLERLNTCITNNEGMVNSANQLLTLFDKRVLDTISDKSVSNLLFGVFGKEASFSPSTGMVSDIISSGNLNLILNKKLRHQLSSFGSLLESIKNQESIADLAKHNAQRQFYKFGSIRKVMIDRNFDFGHNSISDTVNNKLMFNSIELENKLLDYSLTERETNVDFYQNLKSEIEIILLEIDTELNK